MIIFRTKNIRSQSISMARVTTLLGRDYWMTNKQAEAIECLLVGCSVIFAPTLMLILSTP